MALLGRVFVDCCRIALASRSIPLTRPEEDALKPAHREKSCA
jgi:hypothetical protein